MEREFQREKEAAEPRKLLGEENYDRMARMKQIAEGGRVLIKGKEVPFEQGRQGRIRFYLHPLITDTALQPLGGPLLRMFTHDIHTYSGRHIHQGGVGLFVLHGRGYTTTNGVRNDWKEGDLIVLPIMRGGVEHQHFNLDQTGPSRWLAIFTQMIDELMSFYRIQTAMSPDWQGAPGEKEAVIDDVLGQRSGVGPQGTASSEREAGTVWGALFKRRDEQREEVRKSTAVVSFDDLPWEWNRQGKMRWYMHPWKLAGTHILLVYVQELPPGSRSGKLLQQGGRAFYVWKGRGYSVINGVRYDWEPGDLLVLPIAVDGCTFQHFNLDPENPARLLAVAPNLIETLGVDQGLGLEQLENCPEWG